MTVEEIMATVPNGEALITKINIEGFESDLFASNTNWLDQAFAVFIEPHDWLLPNARSSRSFQKVLGEREFDLFVQGENLLYVKANS